MQHDNMRNIVLKLQVDHVIYVKIRGEIAHFLHRKHKNERELNKTQHAWA